MQTDRRLVKFIAKSQVLDKDDLVDSDKSGRGQIKYVRFPLSLHTCEVFTATFFMFQWSTFYNCLYLAGVSAGSSSDVTSASSMHCKVAWSLPWTTYDTGRYCEICF